MKKTTLPSGRVTVDDLLKSDEIKAVIKQVNEAAPEIQNIVVGWIKRDGTMAWAWNGQRNNILYLLEIIKHAFLHDLGEKRK